MIFFKYIQITVSIKYILKLKNYVTRQGSKSGSNSVK